MTLVVVYCTTKIMLKKRNVCFNMVTHGILVSVCTVLLYLFLLFSEQGTNDFIDDVLSSINLDNNRGHPTARYRSRSSILPFGCSSGCPEKNQR